MARQPFGEIKRARPADIMFEQAVEFGVELWIVLGRGIGFFQPEQQRHQRFGDITPAERAEMAARIGAQTVAVGDEGHAAPACFRVLSIARGAHEGGDLFGALLARRVLHPGGRIHEIRPRDADGARDVLLRQAAGRGNQRAAWTYAREQLPVEGRAKAAGPGGGRLSLGVEEEIVRHLLIKACARSKVGGFRDRQRFDDREPR